jgi:hypothetical protein
MLQKLEFYLDFNTVPFFAEKNCEALLNAEKSNK